MHEVILSQYKSLKNENLKIDLTRGKPSSTQLDLSNDLLSTSVGTHSNDGADIRNYGEPYGIYDARKLGAELLETPIANTIAAEQSSLLLSYQFLLANYFYGLNDEPWKEIDNPKFICPTPGFDRHFRMLDEIGIEMLPVPLTGEGLDINILKDTLSQHENIVGMICVPRHSNPSGDIYSDQNMLDIFGACSKYSNTFVFLFDNAYLIHDLSSAPNQSSVWTLASQANVQDQTAILTSFSKVTFGGGGLAFFAAGDKSLSLFKKIRSSMVICPDKVNQLRHVNFFKNKANVIAHMKKHAAIIEPKFELTLSILKNIPAECGTFSNPTGGYFITFNTSKPIAANVIDLCKDAGVLITPAGATFPHGFDAKDSIIRLAPTFVEVEELQKAMEIFSLSVQIAHFDIRV
jgi:DNA-binding transcriptional MocR family regulator